MIYLIAVIFTKVLPDESFGRHSVSVLEVHSHIVTKGMITDIYLLSLLYFNMWDIRTLHFLGTPFTLKGSLYSSTEAELCAYRSIRYKRPARPDVRKAFSVRNGNHASLLELVTPESHPGVNVIGTTSQEQVLTVIYRLYLSLVLITTLTFSQIESTKMSDWAIANSLYAFYIYQCHRSQSSWVEHWEHNNFREFSAKPR